MSPPFPATRVGAIEAMREWLPSVSRYASRRNYVEPGHTNVSRLSPPVRNRLLLEKEVADDAFSHAGERAEKFVQEVYWRSYWKGWLEMRPGIWKRYLRELESLPDSERQRAIAVMDGQSGVEIMDYFARELVETGYLHNHARMWFASFWVHVQRLPWQLGADFFYRHLLDGDAASNTLSWRWVAGLHTRGKTYLVRRSNLEKYVAPEILGGFSGGLAELEKTEATSILETDPPPTADDKAFFPASFDALSGASGLWVHEDELAPEESALGRHVFKGVVVTKPVEIWRQLGFSKARINYQGSCLDDTALRAKGHWKTETESLITPDLVGELVAWASRLSLKQLVTLRPFTGPLADQLPSLQRALESEGIALVCGRRENDLELMPHATHGFFRFWKAIERTRLPKQFSR